ncbi:MAG: translocation/assembly module TamB [Thermoanaerobaculum sp.]|nr:translocation/assembly module TamB [Thermoanaerobaculum sp.]
MRRWWVRAKVGLGALAVLLLLGQTASWWLAKPETQKQLAELVAGRLAALLHQPVQMERARLQIFPLQLILQGVRVGETEQPWLSLGSAQVNLGSLKLADREINLNLLRVKGLEVRSRVFGQGGGEGDQTLPLRITVRQLVVEDATVDRFPVTRDLVLSLTHVDLMLTGRPERGFQGAVFRVGSLRMEGIGPHPLELAVQGWGRVAPGRAEVRRFSLTGHGLAAHLHGEVDWLGTPKAELEGTISGDLRQVDEFFAVGAGLAGDVAAAVQLRLGPAGGFLDAEISSPQVWAAGFAVAQVRGNLHLAADGLEATLEEGTFAGGWVEGSYQLSDFGPRFAHRVAFRGSGLKVDELLAQLGIGRGGLATRANVSGELSWDGEAIGSGRGVAVVQLAQEGEGIPATGQLVLSLRGDGALHVHAPRLLVGGGSLAWRGSLSLGSWRPAWSVSSDGISVRTVSDLLAGWVGTPLIPQQLSGTAVFDLAISGSFSALRVVGPVALSPVCLGSLEADALAGQLEVDASRLRFSAGKLALGRGQAEFSGELAFLGPSPLMSLVFTGGHIPLGRVAQWAGLRFPLEGTASMGGTVSGTLDKPQLQAEMTFTQVSVAGLPLGSGNAQVRWEDGVLYVKPFAVGGVSGEVVVDFPSHHVSVSTRVRGLGLEPVSPVLARLLGGQLEAEFIGSFPWEAPAGKFSLLSTKGLSGTVTLNPRGLEANLERPGQWRFAMELQQRERAFAGRAKLSVQSLAALFAELAGAEVPLDGEVEADMTIARTPSGSPTIVGQLTRATVEAEGERVSLTAPATFTLQGFRFDLPGLNLAGPSARLFLRGSRQEDGRISGNVAASVPAALLGLVWREAAPRGHVELLGEISGTDTAPRMEGMVRVSGASLRVPGLPAPLTGIEGLAELAGDVITLRNLRFAFQGGEGTCSGQILLAPQVELDLALQLAAVRWPVTQGFEPSLDGTLRLSGGLDGLQLTGQLALRRSVFRQDVNLQRLILEELFLRQRATAPGRGLLTFDVRIAVPATLEVHTPLARVVAGGELRLVGDSWQPGLLGQLELAPGGQLELSGVVYEIERATIRFVDSTSIRPYVDLQARGVVQNFTVNVGLSGTLDRLVPNLSSDPPLPEADILALLALGVAPGGEAGTASASAVASSLLTEQLTGAVTKRTRTLLALDQLRIDPFVSAEAGTPTARVTVVKQLSPDWAVTVSTNLSSNREEVVVSRWRVAKDLFLEATRDTDGSYSLEVKWRRRY